MRLDEAAREIAARFERLADWLEARRLPKRTRAAQPAHIYEKIVLHGGTKHGMLCEVRAGVDRVNIPIEPDVRARVEVALDHPAPKALDFARYVYVRQTYGQVIDGEHRTVFYLNGAKLG